MRSLAALVLGTFLCTPLAAEAAPCGHGQAQYWGECRPAPVCEPGCFPQAIMCRDRPVKPRYDVPWAKFLDHERHTMPLYNKRLDRGGVSQEHLAYIPELDVAIGSHLTPSWKPFFVRIRLFVDERADGTLDREYDVELFLANANALFYTELPATIVRSKTERDPLSYLYGRLEAFTNASKKHPIEESDRLEYAALIAKLDDQMCRVEE